MATTQSVDIGTLITRKAGVRGGRPCIAGTGVTVQNIAIMHQQGATPEDIARRKQLTLAQAHAALAYYYANREAIEASISEDEAEHDEQEKEWRQMRDEGRA